MLAGRFLTRSFPNHERLTRDITRARTETEVAPMLPIESDVILHRRGRRLGGGARGLLVLLYFPETGMHSYISDIRAIGPEKQPGIKQKKTACKKNRSALHVTAFVAFHFTRGVFPSFSGTTLLYILVYIAYLASFLFPIYI